MYKELKYFNGEEVIKLVEGKDKVEAIEYNGNNQATIITKDGFRREVTSKYMEYIEQNQDGNEALDLQDNINF